MTLKRTLPAAAILIALIGLIAGAAFAKRGGAGHNPPTRKLEAAFKYALHERSVSLDGCYPAPSRLAKVIAQQSNLKTGVAKGPGSVHRSNVVFVLKKGSSCGHVRMALLSSSGLYILNSASGNIRVQGQRGPRTDPGKSGPARGLVLRQATFQMNKPEQQDRFEVLCPGKTYPLGGGVINHSNPDPDGEGIYPHSYERLGAQRGFHVSTILFDGSPQSTTSRQITVQAVCGRGLIPANPSPHKTVFIKQGETRSATARCPKGQYLITGGFQRTDFGADGGNYVTESRADGSKAWKVSGSAFPLGGGELTAIAYCVRHKGPILKEVSANADIPAGGTASATTPSCPSGLRLTSTGFSTNGSSNAFFVGSSLNGDNTSSTTAFGHFGAASLTAYGYCLRAR